MVSIISTRPDTISDTGLEIRSSKQEENVDWTAINEHTERAALWFLNMITVPPLE